MLARRDNGGIGLLENDPAELERFRCRARIAKNSRVCAYAHDTCQNLRSNAVWRRSVQNVLEPRLVPSMIFRVRPKRIDQDVDVRKDQRRPSIRSSSSALLSRSTPGQVPPPARLTGTDTGGRSGVFIGRRKASLRPCSMRAVRVIPRAAASRRARSSRAWSRRTVVLICRNIHYNMSVCQSWASTAQHSIVFDRATCFIVRQLIAPLHLRPMFAARVRLPRKRRWRPRRSHRESPARGRNPAAKARPR